MEFIVFLFLAVVVTVQAVPTADKVKLDVFYESKCPDCYYFFVDQLRPTSKALSEYLETNLVPYGKARTEETKGKVTFVCQHGESECLLNKIHACALEKFKGDNLHRVLLASCLFDYFTAPITAGMKCTAKFNLKWSEVFDCATGAEGIALMKTNGEKTPLLQQVPYVAVDNYVGDAAFQSLVLSKLQTVVCNTLAKKKVTPAACAGKIDVP